MLAPPDDARERADGLTAAIVFRSPKGSRNRHFALHASREGTAARRRATRIMGLVRQITGAFGPAQRVTLESAPSGSAGEDEVTLRYALARVSLTRQARLSSTDVSILRVALARTGARLLPAALVAREQDRARVDQLILSLSDAPAVER